MAVGRAMFPGTLCAESNVKRTFACASKHSCHIEQLRMRRARTRAPADSAQQRAAERERRKAEKQAERERVRRDNAELKCVPRALALRGLHAYSDGAVSPTHMSKIPKYMHMHICMPTCTCIWLH